MVTQLLLPKVLICGVICKVKDFFYRAANIYANCTNRRVPPCGVINNRFYIIFPLLATPPPRPLPALTYSSRMLNHNAMPVVPIAADTLALQDVN